MPFPRIHCDLRLGPGAQFALAPEAAQHVAKSLRLKTGDSLTVFDGRGGEYEAVIQRVERDRVDVKLGAWHDVDRESTLEIGLVQGLPEADKMDWIIQKAAELGAAWIQPVVCDRSVVRLSGERAARREAHWRRVAVAACEQCGRNRIPDVRPTLGFQSWIAVPASSKPQQVGDPRRRWMLVPDGTPVAAMAPPAGPIELLVGPEGGLSDRELELAGRASEPVALGRRVLRVETAPLVAIAAMHALWGDFA